MAEVVLKNVRKTFGGKVVAVDNFNLTIQDKEFLILVGPSGCGKSTTLRLIAGLEEITEGEIYIDGRLVNNVPPKDRDTAMVFQNYALYPHMTVYENMAFSLRLRKAPKAEIDKRVREAAEILGIGQLLDRHPKKLSGGQRQRVAVGRAIVRNPKVFLFDEPLSNLDAKLRVVMRAELKRLHQELGTTMIYVTHDQTEAMTMGDRLVVMKDALVQQIADPITLYDKPVNQFVAGFIGSPSMNFLKGRLEVSSGSAKFISETFQCSLPIERQTQLQPYAGKPAVLGIRPEDVTLAGPIEGRVQVVEPLGNETIIHVKLAEEPLILRAPPEEGRRHPDEVLHVDFPPDKIHIFEEGSGKSIFGG